MLCCRLAALILRFALGIATASVPCAAVWAANSEPVPTSVAAPSPEWTRDVVEARLAAVPEHHDLDPAVKMRLVDTYGKILEQIHEASEAVARGERFLKQIQQAPDLLSTLQRELDQELPPLKVDLPETATLAQRQQRLSQAETDLSDAESALERWQNEPKHRGDRRVELVKLLDEAKPSLEEVNEQLAAKPSPDEMPEVATSNRWLLESRKATLTAQSSAAQAELRYYEIASEMLPLQRDAAARSAAQAEAIVKHWREDVNERRRHEAAEQAREARRIAAQAHPALRALAERNAVLAKWRQELAVQIETAVHHSEALDLRVETLSTQFEKMQTRVELGRHSSTIGLLLRKQRDELPKLSSARRKIQERAAQVAETSLQLIDLQDERNGLATIDRKLQDVLEGLGPNVDGEERAVLADDVRTMLQTQRNYLDAIIADTNSFLDKLIEQDARERELIVSTQTFAAFCDERILWIRSASAIGPADIRELAAAVPWLTRAQHWQSIANALWFPAVEHLPFAALAMLGWIGWIVAQRRLRYHLRAVGEQASRSTCRSFLLTWRALLVTTVLAAPWPALVALLGWRLTLADSSAEFVGALGKALLQLSLVLGALEWLRQCTRPYGLAAAHFNWDGESLRRVRRGVWWLLFSALPLALMVLLTEAQSNESLKNSLGRLAFLVLQAALIVTAYRALHPARGLLAAAYRQDSQAWWSQLRWVWPVVAVGVPLALAGLAIAGFYYTAVQLAVRWLTTVGLIIGLVVTWGLLLRWSLIAYRQLGERRLQEHRAAHLAESTAAPANVPLEIKLADINQQTRQALRLALAAAVIVGVWGTWVTAFPALAALKHVVLWTTQTHPSGAAAPLAAPITLADVMLSLTWLALTLAISRHCPSLLEITVLKRLPLDAGARYATATVAQYVVFGAGVAASCSALGLEWSQIQWLVAAVSVGLGFGIQEIFANFVSGLILLFERPIRIGDVVTVGDITGKVTHIHLRAATITDWDMRELIVPNKEFVTGRVMNWTLSNTVSRMSIGVGVAYHADPDRVRELLLDVARKHPLVLKDPPPLALLDQFADSTLNFVLRVHMPSLEVAAQLRHELMSQIASRFRAEKIDIAFPQRDIYVHYVDKPEPVPPPVPAPHRSQRTTAGTLEN